ncbi:MAG TPA: hypothetical protein VF802_08720 [Candidatus Limnocylindrales bacterium]
MRSNRIRGLATLATAMAVVLATSVPTGAAGMPAARSALAPAALAATTSGHCADAVTAAPTGPATVSVAATAYGTVLVVGSGPYAGCSLYLLTSDQLHSLTSGAEPYACGGGPNPIGKPCDTVLWPALLTRGSPTAGPGVDPHLLGTVLRDDLPGIPAARQVTYAGQPLYRFFLDEVPGETEGADLFDPVTSPAGIWYLVQPSRGLPAPGRARLVVESATLGDRGPARKVLAAVMDPDFSVFPAAAFPVYTLTVDRAEDRRGGACDGICSAVPWPPVLTSAWAEAGLGVDGRAVGVIVRQDGTRQVTYDRKPLYFFWGDAYIPGIIGAKGIHGADVSTAWGEFEPVRLR